MKAPACTILLLLTLCSSRAKDDDLPEGAHEFADSSMMSGWCRTGKKGKSHGSYSAFRKTPTIADCRLKCLSAFPVCTGIEYREDTQKCEVHYDPITTTKSTSKPVTCQLYCDDGKWQGHTVKLKSCIYDNPGRRTDFPDGSMRPGFCRGRKGKRHGSYKMYREISIEKCRLRCLAAWPGCTAIEYHQDTQRCEVHYHPIITTESTGRPVTCQLFCGEDEWKGPEIESLGACWSHDTQFVRVGNGRCENKPCTETDNARTTYQCYDLCTQYSACRSFYWNANEGICGWCSGSEAVKSDVTDSEGDYSCFST